MRVPLIDWQEFSVRVTVRPRAYDAIRCTGEVFIPELGLEVRYYPCMFEPCPANLDALVEDTVRSALRAPASVRVILDFDWSELEYGRDTSK